MLADSLNRGGALGRGGNGGREPSPSSVSYASIAMIAAGTTAAIGTVALLYKVLQSSSGEAKGDEENNPFQGAPIAVSTSTTQRKTTTSTTTPTPTATADVDDDDLFSPASCAINKAAVDSYEEDQRSRYANAPVVWAGGKAGRDNNTNQQERMRHAKELKAKRLASGDPMWLDYYDGLEEDGDMMWHNNEPMDDDYWKDEEDEEDEWGDLYDDDEWEDDDAANVNDLLGIGGDDSDDTDDISVTDREIYEVARIRWEQLPEELEEVEAKIAKLKKANKKIPGHLLESLKDVEEEIDYTRDYMQRNQEEFGGTRSGKKAGSQNNQTYTLSGPGGAGGGGGQRGYGSGVGHNGQPIGGGPRRFVDPDADEGDQDDNWEFDDEAAKAQDDEEWGYDQYGNELPAEGAGGWGQNHNEILNQKQKKKSTFKKTKKSARAATKKARTESDDRLPPSAQARVDKQFAQMWSQGIAGGIPDGSEDVEQNDRWARYHQATIGGDDEEGAAYDESEDDQMAQDIEDINSMSEEQKELLAKVFLDAYGSQSESDPTTETELAAARAKLTSFTNGGGSAKSHMVNEALEDSVGELLAEHEEALYTKRKSEANAKSTIGASENKEEANVDEGEDEEEWEDASSSDDDGPQGVVNGKAFRATIPAAVLH